MTAIPSTIRVVIPLAMKRRNGRPRIVPPADFDDGPDEQTPDPRLVRAIARAWDWRRRLERGEVLTIQDIAATEKVSDRFISRMMRLAYLSPVVLEKLLVHRRPSALSIRDLSEIVALPWPEQETMVFPE